MTTDEAPHLSAAERRYLERVHAGTGPPAARSGPAIAARKRTRARLLRRGLIDVHATYRTVAWADRPVVVVRDRITPTGRAALTAPAYHAP